jgi:adenylate cyclase
LTEQRAQRRLAAILAADIVGYSRLMEADEVSALARMKELRTELLYPKVAAYGGRIVKTTGDGTLIEFPSAVDAVQHAVDVQREMARRNAAEPVGRRIVLRMGINLGDIIIDGDDIYGDGVNVAARLEGLAEPGGICISGTVHEHVRGKVDAEFDDMGAQALKNISKPVQVYRVALGPTETKGAPALALPDKPSIAVLPFQNMSGDPEQEYFADGMVEDIITALSHFRHLLVIARNSSFTYKGRAVDVKRIGRELGVRYVLEGSVRKVANRVRITGQLIDAGTGAHLWAEHFDGALKDVFDLQDEVATSVVSAIAPRLERVETERAKRKPTESLDAYDYYLRGVDNLHQRARSATDEAQRLLYRAIELDPQFASAYGMAARCYVVRKSQGWVTDAAKDVAEAARLGQKAVELGKDDAVALVMGSFALAYVVHDFDAGVLYNDRARQLNPNLAIAWYFSGRLRLLLGEHDLAIKHFAHFKRMSPLDPFTSSMHAGTAFAHVFAGRYEEAAANAEQALSESPNLHTVLRAAATSFALAGRMEQAQRAIARLRQIDPALRISNLKDQTPLRRSEDMARYAEGMRKAGLPE